jgi:hypothetical protein
MIRIGYIRLPNRPPDVRARRCACAERDACTGAFFFELDFFLLPGDAIKSAAKDPSIVAGVGESSSCVHSTSGHIQEWEGEKG